MDLGSILKSVQEIPDEVHWFCPRIGPDKETVIFDEDLGLPTPNDNDPAEKRRQEQIKQLRERQQLVLDSLRVFAYDGADAIRLQTWIKERLDHVLSSCDVCIREYHKGRKGMKERLETAHEEEDVKSFLEIFDGMNFERIKRGLAIATADLLEIPPTDRNMDNMDPVGLYAIFEALSCEPFLKNDGFLQTHFDQPFRLIQSRKRLKIATYAPAMTYFLFSMDEKRSAWARFVWMKMRRPPMASEFEWAIKEPLLQAMWRVQITNLDRDFMPTFWLGARLIVEKLDKDLITHSLRAMPLDLYKLPLDHFQVDSPSFLDMVITFQLLLAISPSNFWDAMGTISPVNIVDLFFNSPTLENLLLTAQSGSEELEAGLKEALSWMPHLLSSVKTANQTPPCRSLVNILLGRFQQDRYSKYSRTYTFELALECLQQTIRNLVAYASPTLPGNTNAAHIDAATLDEAMDVMTKHYQDLINGFRLAHQEDPHSEVAKTFLDITKHAFMLETNALELDLVRIKSGRSSFRESNAKSASFWKLAVSSITSGDVALSSSMLSGVRGLVGIEKIPDKILTPKFRRYNGQYDDLSAIVRDMLECVNDFRTKDLEIMFESPDTSTALLYQLFSSHSEVRQAALDLLKTVSSATGRREAFGFALSAFFRNMLSGLSQAIDRVARGKVFAPMSAMSRLCSDVLDVLCDQQDGLLRTRVLSKPIAVEVRTFWQKLWYGLSICFDCTEAWSEIRDKADMIDYCRDVMQLAEKLYDENNTFATALTERKDGRNYEDDFKKVRLALLEYPRVHLKSINRFLRFRDDYLNDKSSSLVATLLIRFHNDGIKAEEEALQGVVDVLTRKIRTNLTDKQMAELQRALEIHTDGAIEVVTENEPPRAHKQGDLSAWMKGTTTAQPKTAVAKADAGGIKQFLDQTLQGSAAFKAAFGNKAPAEKKPAAKTSTIPAPVKAIPKAVPNKNDFLRKRKEEQERARRQKEAALAQLKRPGQTGEAGSGLAGLGVVGAEYAVKGAGMMVSSDEEEEDDDDEDDMDRELFGIKKPRKNAAMRAAEEHRRKEMESVKRGPVKKTRQVRSVRDMRARLAPDLSSLHKTILGWDYFHDGDFPPNSSREQYKAVANSFRTPDDYKNTFQPLLTLEAWQGFVKAREENTFRPYEIKIMNRSNVDAFIEVSTTMSHWDNMEISLSEGDICLLSKSRAPATSPDDPHSLSRVHRITRKKQHLEVLYRLMPGNPLVSSLNPNGTVHGAKIQSIVPLEREYGALLGLQYYDLCDEIIKAKPSPLLDYKDDQLKPLISNYTLNKAQAKAVKSAMDNDAFTLIQGPPGSGKTKTIVAIVGALLTDTLKDKGTIIERPKGAAGPQSARDGPPAKKLLVCAPSNAAVDELVMRFKKGIKTTNGVERKINVVRLGRSDAINANVLDVTLDELVSARLGNTDSASEGLKIREETQKIMKEHQAVSEKLREARDKLDAGQAKGADAVTLKEEFEALRRRKAQLNTQVDSARDKENAASRMADLNRRRVQQAVLDESHVICATLSASGHDMFQNLNIEFETVVVDEAAQCVEMSAIIPLKYGCAKCILVGDPKQLPPTVFSKEAARFQYEQSLFVRMQGNSPEDVHLLDTQYRMHPEISLFPSKTFYDGRLLDGGDMAALRKKSWHASDLLGPYRFFDVQGQHEAAVKGHSLINIAEINVAMQLYARLTKDFGDIDFKNQIGIITPYKSQLRELKDRFSRRWGKEILETVEFNTTDAFQGRESEIIIFSCVRASPAGGIGFLQDIRRMNVGLTRAKSSLWVLGNSQSLVRGEFWRQLIEDARARQRYTEGDYLSALQRPLPRRKDSNITVLVSTKPTDAPAAPRAVNGAAQGGPNGQAPTGPRAKAQEQQRPQDPRRRASEQDRPRTPQMKAQEAGGTRNPRLVKKPANGAIKREPGTESSVAIKRERVRSDSVPDVPVKRKRSQDSDIEMPDAPPFESSGAEDDRKPIKRVKDEGKREQSLDGMSDASARSRQSNGGIKPKKEGMTGAPERVAGPPRPKVPGVVKKRKEVDPFIKSKQPKRPKE